MLGIDVVLSRRRRTNTTSTVVPSQQGMGGHPNSTFPWGGRVSAIWHCPCQIGRARVGLPVAGPPIPGNPTPPILIMLDCLNSRHARKDLHGSTAWPPPSALLIAGSQRERAGSRGRALRTCLQGNTRHIGPCVSRGCSSIDADQTANAIADAERSFAVLQDDTRELRSLPLNRPTA
jgi:hypothetical protein